MSEDECWWPECGGADDAPCPECPTPRLEPKQPDENRLAALRLMAERKHEPAIGKAPTDEASVDSRG